VTLPASPPLKLSDILTELQRYSAGQSLSGASDERVLSGVSAGAISFSDYLGKSVVPQVVDSGFQSVATGTQTITLTGKSFGTDVTGRVLVGVFATYLEANGGISGANPLLPSTITIGGQAATNAATGSRGSTSTARLAMTICAANPSGTSGNVVVTLSNPVDGGPATLVWALISTPNISSLTKTASNENNGGNGSNAADYSLTVLNNGTVVAATLQESIITQSYSGLTLRKTIDATVSGNSSCRMTIAYDIRLPAGAPRTVTWASTANNNHEGAAVSWPG
jgi:hypothetical protein